MTTLAAIRRAALRSLIPPPRLALSDWIERELRLPADVSALPGPVRRMPFLAEPIEPPGCPRPAAHKRNPPGERHHRAGPVPIGSRAPRKAPSRRPGAEVVMANDGWGELLRYAATNINLFDYLVGDGL